MIKNLLFFILLSFSILGYSQRELTGIGEWSFYVPHNKGVAIADAGDKIFSASQLGVFSYYKESGEIEVYSKVNGLSDVEIVDIEYHKDLNIIIIAYRNGNLDIIKDNTIINFSEILRKQIVGIKAVNQIYIHNNYALISTTFGVVVFDLEKLEVKETYASLDFEGKPLSVYSSVVVNDNLYLGTESGIIKGDFSGNSNLLDFNNWENIYPDSSISKVVSQNNKIWALKKDSTVMSGLENNWDTISDLNKTEKMFESNGNLYFIINSNLLEYSSSGETNNIENVGSNISDIIIENNTYWMSDINIGLVKYSNNIEERLTPNGPQNSFVFRINYTNNNINVTPGGYNTSTVKLYKTFAVDKLGTTNWYTLGYWSNEAINKIYNINMVLGNNNSKTYYASHTEGLIEESNGNYIIYDESNSPINGLDTTQKNIRVTSLAFDSEDNLWIANHGARNKESIHQLKSDGTWESYSFPQYSSAIYPLKIFVDDNDVKWVTLGSTVGGSGVLVFDEENDQDRLLTTGFQKGDLAENKINDIGFDKDGVVWMVGRAGVSIFQNPESIFDAGEENDASKPIYEGRPLMENEYCTSLAIDGGNRKWIGTENGLFLMNETGTELIQSYNMDNSPLPTNKINDLELHPETGELFIGTDYGLLSLRTNSSDGNSSCKGQIKVFPNPVHPDFNGEVGISVLTDDAEIKITDSWGNLVYSTQANGGTASWNLKDYNKNKAESGVYTILVNGRGRKRSCSESIAIIK